MPYVVSNIAVKVLKREEDEGTLDFAIKADVANHGENEEVMVEIQGLDRDGFEVYALYLRGRVPRGSSKTLSIKEDYVSFADFNGIVKWQYSH